MPREPINVAASIIADVSAGIYRSPAGALKELISNAFDADAGNVRISTGFPKFRTFTCSDDGSGMAPAEFRRVMSHIGGSTKRDVDEKSPVHHRPLVGRIGIGLLAIAQICRRFTVVSSKKGIAKKFRAVIDLDPYMAAEARRRQLGPGADSDVKIGTYEIEEAEEEKEKHYTRIVMERIDRGFRQRLQDVPQERGGFTPRAFAKGAIETFFETVRSGTVAEHGAYAQMVWDLSATSPVEYLDHGPIVDEPKLADLRKQLQAYKFKVFLDGVELRKPVLLPVSKIDHKVYRFKVDKKLEDGRRLSAHGYIYWQRGRIIPRELQGIVVRVRNVAIGNYDPTYLGYPHHEGFKFSQMTGELWVEDGLDPAVNIDRSSFRESDEAFIELQAYLFERLGAGTDEGGGIFTDIKRETKKRRTKTRKDTERQRWRTVGALTHSGTRRPDVNVVRDEKIASGLTFERGVVKVERPLIADMPRKVRELFIATCVVIERELSKEISASQRKRLYEKLARLLTHF
jgi:hypothetical protein